jgi:hypothetical protein
MKNTKYEGKFQVNPEFKVVVWSKMRIDDGTEMNKVRDRIEKRFSILLPLQNLDIILINKF